MNLERVSLGVSRFFLALLILVVWAGSSIFMWLLASFLPFGCHKLGATIRNERLAGELDEADVAVNEYSDGLAVVNFKACTKRSLVTIQHPMRGEVSHVRGLRIGCSAPHIQAVRNNEGALLESEERCMTRVHGAQLI